MKKLIIFSVIIISVLYLFNTNTAQAVILLQDDFEYGQTELFPGDDTGCTNSVMVSSGPWTEIVDERCGNRLGEFSIVDNNSVSFSDSYTGKIPQGNYALRMMTRSWSGSQEASPNLYLSNLNLGSEFWFQFWVARARTGSEMSGNLTFHGIKFPYLSPYGSHEWWSWGNSNAVQGGNDNSNVDPLNSGGADAAWLIPSPDEEITGGCGNGGGNANCWYSSNLMMDDENLEEYAVRPNRWHLVKFHLRNGSGQANKLMEMWIDNRDGSGFHKVMERSNILAPTWSDGRTWNGTFYWVLQQPAAGEGSANQQWFYVDDIVFATTESDLPIYGGATDTTPPTVSGTIIVSANASDNVGVSGVQFRLDGSSLGAEDTSSPYSISWNTTTATNGSHTLTARARDAAGNQTTSSGVTVTVNNVVSDTTPPSAPADLSAAAVSSSQINLSWTASTDNIGVTGYRLERCQGSTCANFSQIATPSGTTYNNTGLSANTTYRYRVRAQDAAGNLSSYSGIVSGTTQAGGGGQTVTLYPTADTYININATNYASDVTLNTYTWPNNQIANATLMKFDLSSIPQNAAIQSASLNLYLTGSDANAGYPAYNNTLYRIINYNPNLSQATGYTYNGTSNWTANTCCYNNIPLAQADISLSYDTQSVNKTNGFKTWNATQLIKDWLNNPSVNYGLLLNSDNTTPADTWRFFASSEYSTATYRPYLTVTYTTETPSYLANLKFTPSLEAVSDLTARNFTVVLYDSSTQTQQAQFTGVPNAQGQIPLPSTVTNLNEGGIYDITVEAEYYLRSRQNSITLNSNSTVTLPSLKAGDLNNDGIVNSLDWSPMNQNWWTSSYPSDINQDGVVNAVDFSWLNRNWLKGDG